MSREESLFEAMGGTYRSVDGILYPNISFLQERMILETDDEGECLDIGKYGLIWISFMKEIHPDRYCHHIRMGELYIKAQEVNEEAYAMLDTIMNQYLAILTAIEDEQKENREKSIEDWISEAILLSREEFIKIVQESSQNVANNMFVNGSRTVNTKVQGS